MAPGTVTKRLHGSTRDHSVLVGVVGVAALPGAPQVQPDHAEAGRERRGEGRHLLEATGEAVDEDDRRPAPFHAVAKLDLPDGENGVATARPAD